MNEREAKQSVADAGRLLLMEGLVARTWGNVSCRTGEQSFVITPSGLAYEGMTAEDVVSFNLYTGEWTGERKPSSEKGVHAAAYRQFSDAGFVIHTHQTYASALGLSGFHAGLFPPEQTAALGGIALAKYGLPGTKKLKSNVAAALATGAHVVLMEQHGALIVGVDRNEAFSRAILLETLCKSACKGQSEEDLRGDEAKAAALKEFVSGAFGYVAVSTAPAVLRTANAASMFRAQLDDMAQIIGPKLFCVDPAPDAVLKALRRHDAVLVKGVGALCRADTRGDCEALPLLVEKACVGYLHTRALGANVALSSFDALLMRTVYQMKYAKKAGAEYGKAAT